MAPYLPNEIWTQVCNDVKNMEHVEHMRLLRLHHRNVDPPLGWCSAVRLVNRQLHDVMTPLRFVHSTVYLRWKPSWKKLERYANSANISRNITSVALSEWFNLGHPERFERNAADDPDMKHILPASEFGAAGQRLCELLREFRNPALTVWGMSPECACILRACFDNPRKPSIKSLELRSENMHKHDADIDCLVPTRNSPSANEKAVFQRYIVDLQELSIFRSRDWESREIAYDVAVQRLSSLQCFSLHGVWDQPRALPPLRFSTSLTRLSLEGIRLSSDNLTATLKGCERSLEKLKLLDIILEGNKASIISPTGWAQVLRQIGAMPQLYRGGKSAQLLLGNLRADDTPRLIWGYYGPMLSHNVADRIAWRDLEAVASPHGLRIPKTFYMSDEWTFPDVARKFAEEDRKSKGLTQDFEQPAGRLRCIADTTSPRRANFRRRGHEPHRRCDNSRALLGHEDASMATWLCNEHR